MFRKTLVLACLPLFGLFACTADRASTGMHDGSGSLDGLDTAPGDDMDEAGDEAGGDGTPPRLDASNGDGGMTGSGDDGENSEGCTAIDFLFVIDNSGSMGDNQQNLVNSFPGFIQAIQNTVTEASDYHVMVVKTDAGWGSTSCEVDCALLGACFTNPNYDCNNPPQPPTACDAEIGAGVTYPSGADSSNQLCNLAGGHRYITTDEPNLGQAFTCMASVGTEGDADERQIQALTAALSEQQNGPGGCNEGFMRDEAILVVTMITDEDDVNSPGLPAGWYQNVISRKAGNGGGVVMIGLLNDTDLANPECAASAPTAPSLVEFVESFPNSYRGSVCAADYASVLADAVSLIDTTCDEYVPPAG